MNDEEKLEILLKIGECIKILEKIASFIGRQIPVGWNAISLPPNRTTDEIDLYFYDPGIRGDHSNFICAGGYEKNKDRFIKYDGYDCGDEGCYCDFAIAWRWRIE